MTNSKERLLRDRDFSFILCRNIESWESSHPFFDDWRLAQSSIIDLGRKCLTYDRNGINLYWASNPVQEIKCADLKALSTMFQEDEHLITDNLTGTIKKVIDYYFSRHDWKININGEIIIVLLDRVPPGSRDIVNLMQDTTHKLDKKHEKEGNYNFGMIFIQVGNDIPTTEFLNFLDDGLEEMGCHDLIDTKPWQSLKQNILSEILQGALTD